MLHTLLLWFFFCCCLLFCYFVLEFDFDVSIFGRPLESGWPHGQRVLGSMPGGPIKSKQIINTYAGSPCVCVCARVFVHMCVSVDRIAFEMRTLSYSKICINGIFCPICGLSDLHCRRKQHNKAQRRFLYSALFEILHQPTPTHARVFALTHFHSQFFNEYSVNKTIVF